MSVADTLGVLHAGARAPGQADDEGHRAVQQVFIAQQLRIRRLAQHLRMHTSARALIVPQSAETGSAQ